MLMGLLYQLFVILLRVGLAVRDGGLIPICYQRRLLVVIELVYDSCSCFGVLLLRSQGSDTN